MSDLVPENDVSRWEAAVMDGNLEALQPMERVALVKKVCESVGLNPLTQPFQYIRLSGKLTLYARRDATDQLRKVHNVAVVIVSRETHGDCYVVTARATMPNGRTDESTGVVPIGGLKGEALANGFMKAETKAKRRVTLSICGLGFLDETEAATIPDAVHVPMPLELPAIAAPVRASREQLASIVDLAKAKGVGAEYWTEVKAKFGIQSSSELTPEQAEWVIGDLNGRGTV